VLDDDVDLIGLSEDLQFTECDDAEAFHTWHQDGLVGELAGRKLSLVVQLSDPDDYEGGDLGLFGLDGRRSHLGLAFEGSRTWDRHRVPGVRVPPRHAVVLGHAAVAGLLQRRATMPRAGPISNGLGKLTLLVTEVGMIDDPESWIEGGLFGCQTNA
jgi:hypothetical protein